MILQRPQNKPHQNWWQWLIWLALGGLILFGPLPAEANAASERHFTIDAGRNQYNPAVLKVNRGDLVSIDLVATDVVHGLAIDGYNLEVTAEPGKTAHLDFMADRQGTFRFRCTVTCGNLHPFMVGKIEVGQNGLLWRAMALAGLALFVGVWKVRR